MKTDKASDSTDKASGAVNEVRLVGRLSRDPEQRVLPSGDEMWTFRVVVPRPEGGRSRQTVDALDCAVWGGRVRASVAGWAADDVVEVAGALRKRFYASGVRPRVAGGGRGDVGTDGPSRERYSSCSERMSTPMLGLGWNDVAFSGSRRPACATRTTRSKSGAGISTATPGVDLTLVSASSTEWW